MVSFKRLQQRKQGINMTQYAILKKQDNATHIQTSNQQLRQVFKAAFKHAFEETNMSPRDFTWFSNKPLNRNA